MSMKWVNFLREIKKCVKVTKIFCYLAAFFCDFKGNLPLKEGKTSFLITKNSVLETIGSK
ncbi:hypothetical protein EsVE80_24270 [Enterococcus saigonensis]|uniref:Uncharacterized protein n=1 Tax=Enterococcus saigonensis TaxID=1805431 RepID=A0A679IRX0_9ENTE|nr:hypothetical protein EsVE80_24270 [Enterococcus saigonensis]